MEQISFTIIEEEGIVYMNIMMENGPLHVPFQLDEETWESPVWRMLDGRVYNLDDTQHSRKYVN